MKHGGRHFTLEQKQEMLFRDGPMCALGCGKIAVDADHAYRLSTYLPYIEETWNGNLLCRQCHTDVTLPDNKQKWEKSLRVLQMALQRLYKAHPYQTHYTAHYNHYKSRVARFKQLYGNE